MKRIYFLAAILVTLILYTVCKNIVVFIKVNPYVGTKPLSYIAPMVKSVGTMLDETKDSASLASAADFKYLYVIERGSEFLPENKIPNDMDFEVGVDLGNYEYDGTNGQAISQDLLNKMESFIYCLNMSLNNNGNYLEKSPLQILQALNSSHTWYDSIITSSIDSISKDKPYIMPSHFLMNNYKNIYRIDFMYKINKDEIWLYGYPKIVFYTDNVKFNKGTRKYLRELTIHPTYYMHLTTNGKTKLVELTTFTVFGINLNPKNTIFSSMVFENFYSYNFIKYMCKKYYLNDDDDIYVQTRLNNLPNHLAEFWYKPREDESYRPIKVIKRLMQAANIMHPIIGDEKYNEIRDLVVKNLDSKEIQLLNEYDNVLNMIYSTKNSVMYKRMMRDGKIADLKTNADELAVLIQNDEKINKKLADSTKKFHEKQLEFYMNSNDETPEEELTPVVEAFKALQTEVHKEIVAQTIDEPKIQEHLSYLKTVFQNAGYHLTYLYWIDTDTIGILRDDYTKGIKDTKEFAKRNVLADFNYKLINANQIPADSTRYNVWTRNNPTPEQEEYFQNMRKALLADKKNFKIRPYFRFGF